MKSKTLIRIVGLNLAALLLLALFLPHLMISPGRLIDAHAELAEDCFACHTPFIGSRPEKCIACHKVAEIGLKTTQGQAIDRERKNVAFHQELSENDCVACHSDHKGVQPFRSIGRFSHRLLDPAKAQQCGGCHADPGDTLHRKIEGDCGACHTQERWTPSTFDHDSWFRRYPAKERQCEACHANPDDGLHRKIEGDCGSCHTTERWIPATFDHDEHFRFDKAHTTECSTCHRNNDYGGYTCYGCHEHSRSKIRAEHLEEGIYDYERCVECHRSGDEHEAEHIWRTKRMKRGEMKEGARNFHRRNHDDEHERDDDD